MSSCPALLAAGLVFIAAGAEATIINVPANHAYIRDAIDAAVDGDIIVIAPGTHSGIGNRNLDFGGKAITVRSTDPDDPDVVAATIIDCLQAGRGFILQSGETLDSVIDGLTITNGFELDGAGVYLLNHSSVTIRNSTFTGNTAPTSSGIIQSDTTPGDGGNLVITNCTITDNLGGGVTSYFLESLSITGTDITGNTGVGVGMSSFGSDSAVIDRCTITANGDSGVIVNGDFVQITGSTIADNADTGLVVRGFFNGTSVEVANCTITGNSSPTSTGGFRCHSDVDTVIQNCLIADNTGNTTGGLFIMGFGAYVVTTSTISGNVAVSFGGGGMLAFGTEPTSIENCILWANDAPQGAQLMLSSGFNNPAVVSIDFSAVQGGEPGVFVDTACCSPSQLAYGRANTTADPLFADPDAGNYHLTESSPVIDAGDPAFVAAPGETDLDGDPRVIGDRVDIGADEFRRAADLDGDGTVGIVDFLALLAAWGPCPDPPAPCQADLNGDGIVGIVDLLLLLAEWG